MKRQTTFRFLQKTLALPSYILAWVEVVGLRDREVASMVTLVESGPWVNIIPAIKYVREQAPGIGLCDAKAYVEACRDAYPEEWK